MTDDQTVEQMGALRRVGSLIGDRGTTFSRSFASFPLCCPSRATYVTGQYAHNHRVFGNKAPEGGYYKLYRGPRPNPNGQDTWPCGSRAPATTRPTSAST